MESKDVILATFKEILQEGDKKEDYRVVKAFIFNLEKLNMDLPFDDMKQEVSNHEKKIYSRRL